MRYWMIIVMLLAPIWGRAQGAQKTLGKDSVYTFVERMPEPPFNLLEYYKKEVKPPKAAQDKGVHGAVPVLFVVNEDGSISNVSPIGNLGYGCEEEAVRVVQNMPKWVPGIQQGIPVKVKLSLRVHFGSEGSDYLGELPYDKWGVISFPTEMPTPDFDLEKFYKENLRVPDRIKQSGDTGHVTVACVIDLAGKVREPFVVKSLGDDCDKEAMRVVKAMPGWNPGLFRGRMMPIRMELKVPFLPKNQQ